MKISTILIFISAFNLLAESGYSQGKDISLKLAKTYTIENVISEIERITDYVFIYNEDVVPTLKQEVKDNINAQSLYEILNQLIKGTDLAYSLSSKQVTLYKDESKKVYTPVTSSAPLVVQQQSGKTITGKVTDANNEPLPGVTVVIKGTTKGTSTDVDGNFSLIDVPDNSTLQFSFVGMKMKVMPIGNQTMFEVVMEEESIGLEEFVAVGYGRQKKVNLTGSVGVINSEEIERRTVNSSVEALQGLAPNLNIGVNMSAGEADASMNINVRGVGSLSSSEPYILINGIRSSNAELAALNPLDIQDISVLKDAASTAIYGAQAAFGVILITTKQGNYNEKFKMKYSASLRQKQRIFVPEVYGGSMKFAEVKNIASFNSTGQYHFSAEHLEKIRAYAEGEIPYQTEADPRNPNYWLGIGAGGAADWSFGFANTDWFDVMYKDKEYAQKHDISVSGGSERITYHISGGYLNDKGALNYGEEDFKRYNFNSSIDIDLTNWLNFSTNLRYFNEYNIFPTTLDAGGESENRSRIYHDVIRFQPLAPWKTPAVYDENGILVVPEQLAQIPAMNEYNGSNVYNKNNLAILLRAKIKITDDLSLMGDFSMKKDFYDRTMNLKKWTFYGPDGKPNLTYQANNNQIQKENRSTNYTSLNVYSNYQKQIFDNHNVGLLLGFQQEEQDFNGLTVARQNVLVNDLNSTNVAVGDIIGPFNPISSWATMGFFGRFNYNFKEKYLIELNGRYDGSSKFESGDRFGFFPSLAVGYNLHRESYWNPLNDIINSFKVRASIGKLGNQDVAGYLYMSTLSINNRLSWVVDNERPVYTTMPGIVSPQITWETSLTKNLGVDFSMLENRLSVEFDIYQRETENMFGPSSAVPNILGTNPPQTNSASLKTNGWETSIKWKDNISNDFNYFVTLMMSDNTSIITKYNNPNKVLTTWYEGMVIGEIWGYEANALFQSEAEVENYLSEVDLSFLGSGWRPGNVKYTDLNDDGKVNSGRNTVDDPGDRKIIGNNQPRYNFSINTGFSWKQFDFNMFWQGVGKRNHFPDPYATLFWGWNLRHATYLTEPAMDFWTKEKPDGFFPVVLNNSSMSGFGKDRIPSTRYIQNSAYIRLKSLNIGYNIPSNPYFEKINLSNMRISVSGENLLTFTKLRKNWTDPELVHVTGFRSGEGRSYPLARTYSLGLSVTF